MVVGVPTLRAIFEEKYYQELAGGISGVAWADFFRGPVRLLRVSDSSSRSQPILKPPPKSRSNLRLQHLYAYLFGEW